MALYRVSRTDLSKGRLDAFWSAFSMTVAGDVIATIIALVGVCAIFLACAYTVNYLVRGVAFVLTRLS